MKEENAQDDTVGADTIRQAASRLAGIARRTPLERSEPLSRLFDAEVWLKREDLQAIRSYKIRGAWNRLARHATEAGRPVVCASAGNHAQAVAWSCRRLGLSGRIFMPLTTPRLKVDRVRFHGGDAVEIVLVGETFDDAQRAALVDAGVRAALYVPPFDDPLVVAGQGTVGLEIAEDAGRPFDVAVLPVGGGGLAAGVATALAGESPGTEIVLAEPAGASSLIAALRAGRPVALDRIDPFVDGAAVRRMGDLTFPLCRAHLDEVVAVPEASVCAALLWLYQNEGIVAEPAGALAVAALERCARRVRGRQVVCVVSGGNNDLARLSEIRRRAEAATGPWEFDPASGAPGPAQAPVATPSGCTAHPVLAG